MGETNNRGIDYSLGQSNFDRKTGIHFGVISQHSISPEAMDDFEPDYGDPTCGDCGNALTDANDESIPDDIQEELDKKLDGKLRDYVCLTCKTSCWSDAAFSEEAQGMSYEDHGYKLADCLDTDIFVFRSPYYTFAQYCSPCVPGAGNLDTYCADGPKTYCLGHDWFEGNRAPYPVYSVEDDSLVEPEKDR